MTSSESSLLRHVLSTITMRDDEIVVVFADDTGRHHEAVANVFEHAGIRGANLTPNLFSRWDGDAAGLRSVVAAVHAFASARELSKNAEATSTCDG